MFAVRKDSPSFTSGAPAASWGSYTEILSGLTADDLIAFPYGKNLKEGAPTVESDPSGLYSY